ncbi:MAG: sucrase ferredoxin [Propionibacteriaceae bacterium]|nr:sucrase ferredoxin [Propionibacteriaceae bacterium]
MQNSQESARCSALWDELSAWGSATRASFWVAIEQPGPWGRDALTESHLDAELGGRLAAASAEAGGRVLLIRAPGHHADASFQSRRVFVAGGLSGRPWLLTGVALDPAALEDLPWADLTGASPDAALAACPWLQPAEAPVLLVCANSKRDVCCALKGRPVALALSAQRPGQVWECSHTGGHRFAPTGLVLPLGQMLARLDADLAGHALDAAASGAFAIGTLSERHDRGVSHLPPHHQAAVSWVRAHEGETAADAFTVAGEADAITVQHVDGRTWALAAHKVEGEALPESCGKAAKPSATWTVTRS